MEADEKLFEIWNEFDFDIDPINSKTEEEIFLKDKNYTPNFEYQKQELKEFQKKLKSIKPNNSWLGKLIKQRIKEFLIKIEMLSNKKNKNFTQHSINLFGKPDKKLLEKAYRELKLKDELEVKNLSDKDAKKIINRALSENNLDNWKIKIREDMSAQAKVDTATKIIYIKEGERFSTAGIERLIVHELQTHAFRMENSQKQKYKLFQVGFPDYLETEEGLAAFNEEQAGYLMHNKLRRLYAGRVIAVDLALKMGFLDVFTELTKYFSEQDAWNLTLRVKRGLSDISKPGAFTKDCLYFSGKIKIEQFLKKHGKLEDLYIGRIGIKHIRPLKERNGIEPASWLPKYNQ